jgi:hypothetical protein
MSSGLPTIVSIPLSRKNLHSFSQKPMPFFPILPLYLPENPLPVLPGRVREKKL